MKVIFYIWSLEKGDTDLIKRIETAFQNLLNESTLPKEDRVINSEIIELASYGEIVHDGGIGIMFGSVRGIIDKYNFVEELPPLSCLTNKPDNKKWRESAFESLQMITDTLAGEVEETTEVLLGEPPPEPDVKVYVKTEEGYTVGEKNTDFIIDETTAGYIKKIKNLIGGSAYMEKDGIRIEIK